MDERARFVLEVEQSYLPFAELCRRHGISRPTGYQWLGRYEEGGIEALHDRSHRPGGCAHATAPAVVERIVQLRERRGWGARKLAKVIELEFGSGPCFDTVHRILQRRGLVTTKKPRRRRTHPGVQSWAADQPNIVWTADLKGQFRTQDGRLCYPLTLQHAHSRFLLGVCALDRITTEAAKRTCTRLFREYGIPDRIRTDNGQPFASHALGRLSQLSVGERKFSTPLSTRIFVTPCPRTTSAIRPNTSSTAARAAATNSGPTVTVWGIAHNVSAFAKRRALPAGPCCSG